MTVPLGFRRSTRKKLRRCERFDLAAVAHASDVQYTEWYKGLRIHEDTRMLAFLPERIATERLRFGPPERIAR